MVARVVAEWGRVDVLVANAGGGRGRPMDTKASNLDPALLQLVVGMNLFGTVYTVNAVAPTMKEQRSGKIITVSSVAGTGTIGGRRLCPLRGREGRYRPLHPVSGPGSRAIRDHRELHRPRRDRDRADHGDGHPRQQPEQSGSGRVGGPAAARQRRGLRQGGRVPGDRPVRLCDRGGDPDRRRAGSRMKAFPISVATQDTSRSIAALSSGSPVRNSQTFSLAAVSTSGFLPPYLSLTVAPE